MNAYDIKTGNPVPRQISPLEEGVWLMPGGSTDVEPPEFNKETHTCSFNGTKWVVEEIPPPESEPEAPEPTFLDKRMMEYGTAEEQLEFITENGLAAWQSKVSEIKTKYTKPE